MKYAPPAYHTMDIVNADAAEAKRLGELRKYNILDTLTETDYEHITFMASMICDVPIALISFVDEHRQWFKSHKGLDATETLREYSFCAHALLSPEKALIVPDSRNDARFKNNPLVTGDPKIVFYAGIPLINDKGFGLGTVCIIDTIPRELTGDQLQALKILSSQVMNLLETRKANTDLALLHQQLENKNQSLEKFARQLAESQSQLATLSDGIKVLLAATDADGKPTYFTRAWSTLTGKSIPQLIKNGLEALVHPEDRELYIHTYRQSFLNKTSFSVEYRLLNSAGVYTSLLSQASPQVLKDGTFIGYISSTIDISELKAAQNKLTATAGRLQLALEAGKLGAYELDIRSGKMKTSTRCNENYGFPPEHDFHFSELLDLIHPEDLPGMQAAVNTAINNNITYEATYRIILPNGELRWIHASGLPVYDKNGEAIQMAGVTANISQEKNASLRLNQAFEEIRASQEKLNIIINASELGTWELDLKTVTIQCSDRYLEILGYEKGASITPLESREHIHPDDTLLREMAFGEAFKNGTLYFKGRIIRKDGFIRWIESKGKVSFDEAHQPLKLVGTINDITAEKTQETILQKSEQKFRLLADSMPQHIWTSDAAGNVTYYNQAAITYSGKIFSDASLHWWLDLIHPDDKAMNMEAWAYAVSTGEELTMEFRFRRFDGEYRWQLSRAIPQMDADGNIQMWVGTNTDIHEQKIFTEELERQVIERTKELEQKNIDLENINKELEAFVYISSHDLQEPLRKIQTFASRIVETEKVNLTYNGQDYFRRMEHAAFKMQSLITDLLSYSRMSTAEKVYEKTDLNKIVEEVKQDLCEELEEKHAVIETGELCEISIIPFQFRQLLQNLFSNAIKFSKQDVPPHITIGSQIIQGDKFNDKNLQPDKKYCHITITDNGIGFEQQYREKIFELFQRLHSRLEYKGTGLGLAIVKKIVGNHNGHVTADGMPGKGARFDIYLPVE